jgi:predicted nucleotidyltransferase
MKASSWVRREREIGQMNPLIEQQREAIRAICREFGISRLELFGSAATDAFDPTSSDVDFIVDYPPDYDFGPWLARYFEFKERLEALLARQVDLVMAGAPRNPYVIQSIDETRQLLYAA